MGCDIHPHVERRVNGKWEVLESDPPALKHRNYNTFAILADVRNGSGFAGIRTGGGFNPIAEPRGLPDDLSDELQGVKEERRAYEDEPRWFGDHSFTWLTLREILEYDYQQSTSERGVLTPDVWLKLEHDRDWKAKVYDEDMARPEQWSGMISGGDTVIISAEEARRRVKDAGFEIQNWKHKESIVKLFPPHTYIEDEWGIYYFQAIRGFLVGCIKYVKYGLDDVRIVMGFDS